MLQRKWIGIEREPEYVNIAHKRIDGLEPHDLDDPRFDVRDRRRLAPRVPFARLLEAGYLRPGQPLFYKGQPDQVARIKPNGHLVMGEMEGSIHQVCKMMGRNNPSNGWDLWHYTDEQGKMHPIDQLRQRYRREKLQTKE